MKPSENKWRPLFIVLGLLAGVGLAAMLIANRQSPAHGEIEPVVPTLTVITVQPLDFQLEARGYGVTRAANSWQAVANLPGRVVERHPRLESGALVRKDTLLLALDPSRYKLAIADIEAELVSLSAELSQLDTEQENTRRLLKLEQTRLVLADQELSRIERLVNSGSVSQSRHDEQQRATLAQRQAVTTLENQLALLPSRKDHLQARIDRAMTRLEQARQDLADTRFVAPYDLRIDEVNIELHQYATAGQRLFRADSIAQAEIETHVPLPTLRRLVGSVLYTAPGPDALDISEQVDFSAIDIEVRLAGAEQIRWPARVTRVASGLDPATRTARVVVVVDAPYERVTPSEHPHMQPGMYVQVYLSTMNRDPLLVIPATALHKNEVYRVTDDNRLERRPVVVAFEQNDLAVISSGLSPGDRIIVDDPVPALDGMAIQPLQGEEQEKRLRARARGKLL
ncbi:MAG: efflux RND transporter periplasmic adaptor subunit [Sedimenticola sp.]|nr:efflux RND transporter periplasmic adaptor subunit [Sedimenticola sp.]